MYTSSFIFICSSILYVSGSGCSCSSFTETVPKHFFNQILDNQNPSSFCSLSTDAGGQSPFKYPFSFAQRAIYNGGWTRQVTERDLPISTEMAGAQMRLFKGGIRELHWHVPSEWGYMIYGNARITIVDPDGRSYVDDVKAGDVWQFPGGYPHSIQGIGNDGAFFVLVFNDGNFNQFETFMLIDWMHHVPIDVLAKNFKVDGSTFADLPTKDPYIFTGQLPQALNVEREEAAKGTGISPQTFSFHLNEMKPNVTRNGGEVKIIDANNFPVTDISAAIVTLKPGALRELHWHPNADEWQYYVTGRARMGVFNGGGQARTMDFQAGDVGYVPKSFGHYVENVGTDDLVFLEVFATPYYQSISLAEWLAHTPPVMVNATLNTGMQFINAINKKEVVIQP